MPSRRYSLLTISYSLFGRENHWLPDGISFVLLFNCVTPIIFRSTKMFRQNITSFPFDFLFRKSPSFDESFEAEKLKDAPIDFSRIRCPLCRWQPRTSSRWFCGDADLHFGCGTAWNTFDTRGRCPGCHYRWQKTDCLRCGKSSPHEAWYAESTG
ncbi:MAG: hypothetical protein LH472_01400 [Pyrinomonadaceae bacterium]|nr:hypothetical protein [Pyrinomonadaceae bacterium]